MNLFARVAHVIIGCLCAFSLASDLPGQTKGSALPNLPTQPHNPTVDVSMNNADFVSPALCEASCFTATYRFSTVPYYSLDQPRNVTLVYNGDQAVPRPFIFADVDDGGDGTGVTQYTMQATLNGATVTFLNGQTVLTFTGSQSGIPVRLAGQFDARAYATDIYPLVITVGATYWDGVVKVKSATTQLMVVNEANSQVAKGWTVAGLQHNYATGYGTPSAGFMITNGDGSAVRFSGIGAKAADFTILTFDSPSLSYTRTYPNGSRTTFDQYGKQTSVVESDGRTLTYLYDPQGRIQGIRDPYRKQPSGAVTTIGLWYDANGLRGIQEPGVDGTEWQGRNTIFLVDGNRCLVSALDPDNVYTNFTCDANGRLSTITDRKGSVTTLAYHSFTWKLSQVILPSVPVDAGGGATTNTNPVINYGPWQAMGLPQSVTSPSAPWYAPLTSSVYGSVTDPAGRVTSFKPNRHGQGIDITNPAGMHTVMTTYYGFLPRSITFPNGAMDTLAYDTYGRVTKSHPAGQLLTTYTYNAAGLLATIGGPGARAETRTYTNNRLTFISYGGTPAQTLTYSYDPATGRVASVKDNSGHTTTYIYDPKFGNRQQETLPGNRTTSKVFDAIGRDSVTTLPLMAAQTTVYDIMNRATSTSGGGATTTLGYDQLFQTDLYDGNGNHHHTDYNALAWPTRGCDALSLCSTARYDASGALTSTTNRRNQLVTLTRDGTGRLTSQTGAGMVANNYSYSSDGRIMVAWNSVQRDSIFTNPGSQTLRASDSVVTWIDGKRFRVLNRPARALADSDFKSIITNIGVTFSDRLALYSSSGFLSSLNIGSTVVPFSVDADGTGGTTTLPGSGTRTSYALAFHATGRVAFSNTNLGQGFQRGYHYDQAGRIDQVMIGTSNNNQAGFFYDALGRLTLAGSYTGCMPRPGTDSISGATYFCTTPVSSQSFSYDAMGNRIDLGGVPTTGNRYTVFNGGSYYYDADGNVVQKYKDAVYNRQWYWNARGQLDSAIKNSWGRNSYDYNALGKPVRIWNGDPYGRYVARYLLWDGDALLAEIVPSGREVDYIYFPGSIDRPFAHTIGLTTPTSVRYHEVDELGNVLGTSESGFISQNNTYDAWGTPTYGGNADQHLLWKGLYWNSDETGLTLMRNRWYDPEGGRFVSEDPAGFQGGMNLYAFAGDDPINGTDPYGLWCVKIPLPWGSLKVGDDCNGKHAPGPLKKGPLEKGGQAEAWALRNLGNRLTMAKSYTCTVGWYNGGYMFGVQGIDYVHSIVVQARPSLGCSDDTYLYTGSDFPPLMVTAGPLNAQSVSYLFDARGLRGIGYHLGFQISGGELSLSLPIVSFPWAGGYTCAKVGTGCR